jgi:hypothetical protein
MTPEEYRTAFIKSRLGGAGMTITDTPIPQRSVQTVPIQPTEPVRTDVIPPTGGAPTDPAAPPMRMPSPDAVQAWRNGVQPPDPTIPPAAPAIPPLPPRPPQAFPTQQADAVPYAPPGVSLTSAPEATPAPGWAGTVGMTNPDEAKGFDKGQKYGTALASLDEIAKGFKPKAPTGNPFPVVTAEQPNQPNQMAMQLMAAIMAGKNRGLTLTGR